MFIKVSVSVGPRTSALRAEGLRPFGPRFHPAQYPQAQHPYLKIPSYGLPTELNTEHCDGYNLLYACLLFLITEFTNYLKN